MPVDLSRPLIIALTLLALSFSSACWTMSECDPDAYKANCSEGEALNCVKRPYFENDGEGWMIDRVPCGMSGAWNSESRGPKCIIITPAANHNKPYATCSFDDKPGEVCTSEDAHSVCVDDESYGCMFGVRDFKYTNSTSCKDK